MDSKLDVSKPHLLIRSEISTSSKLDAAPAAGSVLLTACGTSGDEKDKEHSVDDTRWNKMVEIR
jgi:hypothetical protein